MNRLREAVRVRRKREKNKQWGQGREETRVGDIRDIFIITLFLFNIILAHFLSFNFPLSYQFLLVALQPHMLAALSEVQDDITVATRFQFMRIVCSLISIRFFSLLFTHNFD